MTKTDVMKGLLYFGLITCLALASCKKDNEEPEDEDQTTTTPTPPSSVTAPCTPTTNWVLYNFQNINYTNVNGGTGGSFYGDWTIIGHASNSDLRVDFGAIDPPTGVYVTLGATSFINANQCVVNGTFGTTLGYHYVAAAGDSVYVNNLGNGEYTATFCGLTFSSGSTSYVFTTDGNLTTN
jgi:hypothetical protein